METIKRRYHLNLELGADSLPELVKGLKNLQFDLLRSCEYMEGSEINDTYHAISGSPQSGYNLSLEFDPDMDHDKYIEQINAHIKNGKKSS